MSWSPSRRAAIDPTMDASAPSARWVWPRMTPGCSSNVRFTRSSNSRIRNIWVKTQTSRSRSSTPDCPFPLIAAPPSVSPDRRPELGAGRLVGPLEDLLHGQVAELLGEDLDAPRPRVAHVAADVNVGGDAELALPRQAPVIDRLVDRVGHVFALAVAELDPSEVLERDASQLL